MPVLNNNYFYTQKKLVSRISLNLVGVFLSDGLGNRRELHVAGALVDGADLAVPVKLLLREGGGESDSAHEVDAL